MVIVIAAAIFVIVLVIGILMVLMVKKKGKEGKLEGANYHGIFCNGNYLGSR